VKPEIKQAGVGLVPGHGRDALVGRRRDRQGLVAAGLQRDRKRFTEDAIIVTQNQPHRVAPLRAQTTLVVPSLLLTQ
jgi:hypothetical protein